MKSLLLSLLLSLCLMPAQAQFWKRDKPKEPDKHAPTVTAVSEGAIRMPAGVDLDRVRLLDQGRKLKVYAEMVGIGAGGRRDDAADAAQVQRHAGTQPPLRDLRCQQHGHR
jgi:hypothetical protein